MANQSGNQTRINLTDGLILNKNKCEVTQFSGFKKRNSPYYNGGVAPMYKTEKTGEVIDKDGNSYKLNYTNNALTLLKNNEEYASLMPGAYPGYNAPDPMTCIEKEVIDNDDINLWAKEPGFTLTKDNYWKISIDSGNIALDWHSIEGNNSGSIHLGDAYYLGDSYKFYIKAHSPESVGSEDEYLTVVAVTDRIGDDNGAHYYIIKNKTLIHSAEGQTDTTQTYLSLEMFAEIGSDDNLYFYFFWQNRTDNGLSVMFAAPSYIYSEAVGGIFFDLQTLLQSSLVDLSLALYGADENWGVWEITRRIDGYIDFRTLSLIYDGSRVSCTEKDIPFFIPGDSGLTFNDDYKYFRTNGLTYLTGTYNEGSYIYSFMFYDLNGGYHIGSGMNEDGSVPINCKLNVLEEDISGSFISIDYLFNNSNLSGVSHAGVLLTPWLDVDVGVMLPYCYVSNGKCYIIYFSKSLQSFVKITIKIISSVDDLSLRLIDNRYIVINKGGYNCYDLKEKKLTQYASDWNNRILLGTKTIDWDSSPLASGRTVGRGSGIIGSGINTDYENSVAITSALFNPSPLINTIRIPCPPPSEESLYIPVDVYIGEAEGSAEYYSTARYGKGYYAGTYVCQFSVDKTKEGTTYPITTDGNILLSPSIFADFYETKLLTDYIKENGVYYNLVYTEGDVVLLYPYGTGVRNAQESFVIQGQRYVIRNSVICAATISDGLLTVGEGIVNVGSLQFIGCLPSAAYFYSPATECLMAFTGDRLLSTVFEATEIEAIVCSDYSPNSNALYIASADAVYSLFSTPDGNSFIYKIECAGVTAIKILNDGTVAFKVDDNFYIYSIYPRTNYNKIPVELSTEFYGYGENRVSVIDSWYIRLYSEEAEEGTLILKVESITDGSTESETKTVRINKTDWDSNGFYYYRYQPQIQRGVGVSLSIKSDFTVYDLQASYSPDSTLQLTSKANTRNNANTF